MSKQDKAFLIRELEAEVAELRATLERMEGINTLLQRRLEAKEKSYKALDELHDERCKEIEHLESSTALFNDIEFMLKVERSTSKRLAQQNAELSMKLERLPAEERARTLNEWIELALVAGGGLRQGRPIDGLLCAMLAERSGALEEPQSEER